MDTGIAAQVKKMKTVYWAMSLVQVVFAVAVYVMLAQGSLGKPDYQYALFWQKVLLFFVPVSMATGYFLFRYQLGRLDKKLPLDVKVKNYLTLIMVRAAFFEVAFFICCIAAFVTHVQLFLWIAPVIFFVFMLLRPTPEGIVSDLDLSPADRNKLIQ